MMNKSTKVSVYVVLASVVLTAIVVATAIAVKDLACRDALGMVSEMRMTSGVCAAQAYEFLPFAVGTFMTSVIAILLNLWALKQLKV